MASFFKTTLAAWDRLHPTVAATIGGVAGAAALGACGAQGLAARLDFSAVLMRGLLPFLLFAGALHVDPPGLRREGGFIAALSTAGVVIAALFVGFAAHVALGLAGLRVPLPACLLFGALISPTDPIAVVAVFRRANVPLALAITVGAESLFNDGMAVVLFASILGAANGDGVSLPRASLLFLVQTGGGLLFGLLLGEIAARCVDSLERPSLQLAATAVLAFAGYSCANALHVSGLLAVVLTGIRVGGRSLRLKAAWLTIDGALNLVVFALLGLEAAAVPWSRTAVCAGLLAVPLVLAGRALSVALPMAVLRPWRTFVPGTFRALTWGGLRGAIPLALALNLPAGPEKSLILVSTYVVGLFSLLIQGSTI
jgi:CPA1 family monovalent cation:H+ antiporter